MLYPLCVRHLLLHPGHSEAVGVGAGVLLGLRVKVKGPAGDQGGVSQ